MLMMMLVLMVVLLLLLLRCYPVRGARRDSRRAFWPPRRTSSSPSPVNIGNDLGHFATNFFFVVEPYRDVNASSMQ